ncbi:ABC transporter permease [Couchioplanes caeruleus]|uniref:FtsX-like permease family protein n=1 Tax=Couchioplanes caeruleus TaxID=56438 RepID=UPI0020C091A8|nr:FtsX-like permease family protein [Couchioplanes caeruleus]UQU66906.1 ABC transporter permease [Couchioplanes caeruleus]
MLALVLGAVRARKAQALTVLVLTALAGAVAVAGPWYGLAAASRAAASDVAHAPPAQRVVSVRQITGIGGDPQRALDAFAGTVRGMLPVPDLEPVRGMTLAQNAVVRDRTPAMSLSYREDFCSHVRLTGDCPSRPGQVAVSRDAAEQLGVRIGGDLHLAATELSEPVRLRVVGTYTVLDPGGAYWSNRLYRAGDGPDPAFTVIGTFADPLLLEPTLTYDVGVPEALIRGDGGYDLATVLRRAGGAFEDADLRLVNPTDPLLQTIARDRAIVRDGVLVALGQVLVLGWFAMGLAGRYTGRERRGDAALLKLRGSTRAGMLWLAFGQHLLPMVVGALAGAPLGWLAARALAGPVPADDRALAAQLSVAALAAVLLGGLLVMVAVETAVLRLPVAQLLRRVPSGRRDWRADLADLVLVAVAVAAVYQARAGEPGRGLALVAPALVALAVGLLLARLLGRAADRGAGAALRAGRLRLGLTAARVSRQPGSDRVFALLTVAVAVFATAAGAWSAGRTARVERGEVELGAPRVLTVQAPNRTALQYAVHKADPAGRSAMAVVADLDSVPPVLAVESSRLAAIARWQPGYGDVATLASAAGAAPLPEVPAVDGDRLSLRARNEGKEDLRIRVVLQNEATGLPATVTLGPLRPGEHTVGARVTGCTGAPGCRLVRWELARAPRAGEPDGPPFGARVTVRALTQRNPARPVLDEAALGDIRRWRPDLSGPAVQLAARPGGLTLAMDPGESGSSPRTRVYAVDAPLPLPIVLAGEAPNAWQFGDPQLFSIGGSPVTVRVAGTAGVLPVLGRTGVLVDLDAARRVAADGDLGGAFQVWLAADAPASTVDALRAAGLTVVGDDSVSARAGLLAQQGTAMGATFALLAAAVAVLLAAAAVAVATTVDRGPLLDLLRALRVQGLPGRAATRIGYAGTAALVVAGVLAGVLAAVLGRVVAGVPAAPFTDGWAVVPLPDPLRAGPLAVAGLLAFAALGAAGWLSALPIVRRLRARNGGDR